MGGVADRKPRTFPFFRPSGCPRPECRNLPLRPDLLFYRCHYVTKGYPGGIALFDCDRCGRSFSLRRFSVEFYLHRPGRTVGTIAGFVSSLSLRQAERIPQGSKCKDWDNRPLKRKAIERRLERLGHHAHRLLRRAVRDRLSLDGEFQLDEAESFESDRRLGPVTIPVLVHRDTRYTLAASVATLAPRIRPGDPKWHERQAEKLLPRSNRSNQAVSRCLAALVKAAVPGKSSLATDRKPSYAMLLRRLDPKSAIRHAVHSSQLPRSTRNPLFPVNHLLAMTRDGLSRMRRRTWCASKKRARLWAHLGIYLAWKNFVRSRFNEERKSAAQLAGAVKRRWRIADLVRWRIDLGKVSLSPWEREPTPAAAA